VRDLADYLTLIQIEPQFNARVLQVIIAAAGKGLVRAKPQRERRTYGEYENRNDSNASAPFASLDQPSHEQSAVVLFPHFHSPDSGRSRSGALFAQIGIFFANPVFPPGRKEVDIHRILERYGRMRNICGNVKDFAAADDYFSIVKHEFQGA
jgi:hypothetical protein